MTKKRYAVRSNQSAPPPPKQIDYERMKALMPAHRTALNVAQASGDPLAIQAACRAAVKLWDECGAWPDSWHDWKRALEDSLPWNVQVDFDEVVYGLSEIVEVTE